MELLNLVKLTLKNNSKNQITRGDLIMIIMLIFFISILCCVLYITIKAAIMDIRIRNYKGRTIGKVINVNEKILYNKLNKKKLYYATYRYIVDEVIYEEDFPFYHKLPDLIPIGQEKMISYSEKKPKNFIPDGEENVWFYQAFIGFSCILFWLIIAIYAYYKDFK